MKKLFGLLLLCILAIGLKAQSGNTLDILYTTDGSVFKGEIVSWNADGKILFKTLNGTEIPIPMEEVKKIRQKTRQGLRPYAFREKGIYNQTGFGLSWGPQPGISVEHVIGYRFNRWFGAGIGVGYDNFETGDGKRIVPVFGEVRGFLLPKVITPYYAFQVGYGFAFGREDFSITDARGGLMLNPEIGFRFGAGAHVNILAGIGLHLQKARFTQEWPWTDAVNVDRIHYKRIEFKVGMLF